ncbi:MAG: hypothetical protein HOH05_05545 [Marinovum sp.]|nr:hypothetical protein [Marinovum sp.]
MGSLCLVPKGEPLKALEEDYGKMIEAGLLQSDAVSFGELMNRLTKLQNRANARDR